jgi:hypothetical protein
VAALLTESALAAAALARPGLIPIAIDATQRLATWIDLNGYHCYDGFFGDSLISYRGLSGSEPVRFSSALSSLPALNRVIGSGCMQPNGFIFHSGRCGSSLLVKSLARSRRNLVFGEAAPHNQIWRALPAEVDARTEIYRSLLVLMGRRRLLSYGAHIVKFTSFNIMQYRRIREAFPNVPALFLFREPRSIFESFRRKPPDWAGGDPGIGRVLETPEAAVEDYFRAALSISDARFRCLDYKILSVQTLPSILRFFGLEASSVELRLMSSEFAWDSKSISPTAFSPRSAGPPDHVPQRIMDLYQCLTSHWPLVT